MLDSIRWYSFKVCRVPGGLRYTKGDFRDFNGFQRGSTISLPSSAALRYGKLLETNDLKLLESKDLRYGKLLESKDLIKLVRFLRSLLQSEDLKFERFLVLLVCRERILKTAAHVYASCRRL